MSPIFGAFSALQWKLYLPAPILQIMELKRVGFSLWRMLKLVSTSNSLMLGNRKLGNALERTEYRDCMDWFMPPQLIQHVNNHYKFNYLEIPDGSHIRLFWITAFKATQCVLFFAHSYRKSLSTCLIIEMRLWWLLFESIYRLFVIMAFFIIADRKNKPEHNKRKTNIQLYVVRGGSLYIGCFSEDEPSAFLYTKEALIVKLSSESTALKSFKRLIKLSIEPWGIKSKLCLWATSFLILLIILRQLYIEVKSTISTFIKLIDKRTDSK